MPSSDKSVFLGKETALQLQEMAGALPFDQGIYHNQAYETLIRNLKPARLGFA